MAIIIERQEDPACSSPSADFLTASSGSRPWARWRRPTTRASWCPRSARAGGGGVRLVFVLGDRFIGYIVGAMKEDAGLVGHAGAWKGGRRRQRHGLGCPPLDGLRLDGPGQVQAVRPGRAGRGDRLGGRPGVSYARPGGRRARSAIGPGRRDPDDRAREAIRSGRSRHVASISRSAVARCSAMSGPTAPARARRSGACSTSSGRRGGSVEVLGLSPRPPASEVRRRIGYVPGELRLPERMTSRQLVDSIGQDPRRTPGRRRTHDCGAPRDRSRPADPRPVHGQSAQGRAAACLRATPGPADPR